AAAGQVLRGDNGAPAVSDLSNICRIEFEIFDRILEHSGARFPAAVGTGHVRVLGAVVAGIDVRALSVEKRFKMGTYRLIIIHGENPARDAGLVGYDYRRHASIVDALDGGGGARQQAYLLRYFDVVRVF